MKNTNVKITKIIASIGTVLVWIPILFTLVIGLIASIKSGTFLMDYLMPAELFWVVLVGALMLLWAAIRSGKYKKSILWWLVIMVSSLVLCQITAVLTGLASGETEAVGWPWFLVIMLLIFYIVAVIAQCILGILLLLKLKREL